MTEIKNFQQTLTESNVREIKGHADFYKQHPDGFEIVKIYGDESWDAVQPLLQPDMTISLRNIQWNINPHDRNSQKYHKTTYPTKIPGAVLVVTEMEQSTSASKRVTGNEVHFYGINSYKDNFSTK